MPAGSDSGEPSLDEITTTLYESISTGVADDLFSDEHTAVIGHALQFSVEGRERPQPRTVWFCYQIQAFVDLPTDHIMAGRRMPLEPVRKRCYMLRPGLCLFL